MMINFKTNNAAKFIRIKLLSMILVIILISTLNPVSLASNNKNNLIIQETSQPSWEINDSWTYFIDLSIEENNSRLNLTCEQLTLTVIDIHETTYTLCFFGNLTGDAKTSEYGIVRKILGSIEGYVDIGKSNFSFQRIYDTIIHGYLQKNMVFKEFESTIDLISTSPKISLISFPLFVGEKWSTPVANLELNGRIEMQPDIHYNLNLTQPFEIPSNNFNCTEITNFYLDGYGLNLISYNISEEINHNMSLMYSPNVSSIVKASCNDLQVGNYTVSCNLHLIDTSYLNDDRILVEIVEPKENSFYFLKRCFKFFHPVTTIVLGKIDVEANVTGGEGDITVTFYLNDKEIENKTCNPYRITLNERKFGRICELRVVAKDEHGRTAEDSMMIRIYNMIKII